MKKAEQRMVNDLAEAMYRSAIEEYEHECEYSDCERLRFCQAWVYETTDYYLLRSYGTIVAVIDKASDILVDVLRMVYGYTPTSAKHISKFRSATCFGGYGKGNWGCEHELRWYSVD